jgi:hypothetical protein
MSHSQLDELDGRFQQKNMLMEGLSKGMFSWSRLSEGLKRDVDLAIAAAQSKRCPDFPTVLQHVDDKRKAWVEWAFKKPAATRGDSSMWGQHLENFYWIETSWNKRFRNAISQSDICLPICWKIRGFSSLFSIPTSSHSQSFPKRSF